MKIARFLTVKRAWDDSGEVIERRGETMKGPERRHKLGERANAGALVPRQNSIRAQNCLWLTVKTREGIGG